jgi:hypothetical protein
MSEVDTEQLGYVALPNGKYAVIIQEADLSERACRLIDAASLKAGKVTSAVKAAGLDIDTATLQEIYNFVDADFRTILKEYHDTLIVNMVWDWNVQEHLPTTDSVTDLPRPVFEALAKACNEEYNKVTDFSQSDKNQADPKAAGGS